MPNTKTKIRPLNNKFIVIVVVLIACYYSPGMDTHITCSYIECDFSDTLIFLLIFLIYTDSFK